MARLILSLVSLLIGLSVFAQQDSLVYQFWKRDPNSEMPNTISNQKQIITKEQILNSGYILVSDVLQLVDGWTMGTWNGDRWNLLSNGVSSYQQQNWILMLDGVKMELLKLDAPNINTIGISVYEIERIEVINAVGNYLGEFNDKGIIHIISKRSKDGLTFRSFISNGNEIGDPHLNAINSPGLNVHEYGTVFANHIAYKKNKWNVQLSQYGNNYFYRDTGVLIYPLVSKYNADSSSFNTLFSGRLLATYSSTKSIHQFSFNYNNADDVILPAGIFKPIIGKNTYYTAGYILRYILPKGILQYRGNYTQREFKAGLHQRLTHEQYYQSHNLNYTLKQKAASGISILQSGLDMSHTATTLSSVSQGRFTDYLIRPYFSYSYPRSKKSTVFTDISLATNFESVLPKLLLGYYKQPSIIANWSFVTSFSQRSHYENNTYPYLLLLEDTNSTGIPNNSSSLATFDYYFNLNVSKYFLLSFNSGLKYLSNETFFKPVSDGQSAPTHLFNTTPVLVSQGYWLNRINIHYNLLKGTQLDINYLLMNRFGNTSALMTSIPRHKFSIVLNHAMRSRFVFWSRYYYQSKVQFINPNFINEESAMGTINPYATIGSLHLVDVGLTKKLMKDYLITSLTIRNAFNSPEKYQTNGAQFYLRLFLSLRINI
jgi:hypothetical protein